MSGKYKSFESRINNLIVRLRPGIPKRALEVVPQAGETDAEALARTLTTHPDQRYLKLYAAGIQFPIAYLSQHPEELYYE